MAAAGGNGSSGGDDEPMTVYAREKETFSDKLVRRFKHNPLIPIGLVLVVGVLSRGIAAFQRGDKRTSYRMMRYRVLFQGATALVLVFGVYFQATQKPDPAAGKSFAVDKRFFLDAAHEYTFEDGKATPRDEAER